MQEASPELLGMMTIRVINLSISGSKVVDLSWSVSPNRSAQSRGEKTLARIQIGV
jgi:hypothetical protein